MGFENAMANEPDKPIDDALARIERDLELLRQGLSLLDVKPCSRCRRFFRAEPGALFDSGRELICFGCIPQWWPQRSPELSVNDRELMEHRLVRWLLTRHHAHVIHQAEKLPPDQSQEFRLVTACEECGGTGTLTGSRCHYCNGRGTLWVVIPRNPT
jgi:hypothetical protein